MARLCLLPSATSLVLPHIRYPLKISGLVIELYCWGWSKASLCIKSWCVPVFRKECLSHDGPERREEGWIPWIFNSIALFLFLAMLGLCYRVRTFSSCNAWASLVAHGLRCPATRRISDPQPQMKPTSPVLEGGFSTVGPPGLPLNFLRVFTLEGVECRLQVEY